MPYVVSSAAQLCSKGRVYFLHGVFEFCTPVEDGMDFDASFSAAVGPFTVQNDGSGIWSGFPLPCLVSEAVRITSSTLLSFLVRESS